MRPRHAGPSESHRIWTWPSLLRNQVKYHLILNNYFFYSWKSILKILIFSVLTYYGVNSVFENAIRAALVSRRQQRFWLAGFKRVQRPLLQVKCQKKSPKTYNNELLIAFSTLRLHFAHLNRATQICTSRPVLTLRISKPFTVAR